MNSLEYLADKKLNMDLIIQFDAKQILCIGLRLRPWTQQAKRPLMILSQGLTLQDCVDKAARDYFLDRWMDLDWRRRPWDSEKLTFVGKPEEIVLDFMTNITLAEPSDQEALQSPPDPPTNINTRKMGRTSS